MFRQQWLTDTIVELTDTLVADYDVVEFAEGLTERCVELLEASMVGIVLTRRSGLGAQLRFLERANARPGTA